MSDTSTRSGMLWEVERILTECKELGQLPQLLLMENVPNIHSLDNLSDFHKLQVRLEELGYKSYWQDLIATDYGIPQTRNRCFMISILGDYSYTFPKPIPLKLKLKDMLEENVDEKYYLSNKTLEQISNWKSYQNPLDNVLGQESVSPTITTRIAESQDGGINASMKVYCDKLKNTANIRIKNEVINTYDEYNHKINDNETIGTIQAMYPTPNHGHRLIVKNNYGGTYQYAKSDNFMQGKETSDTIQTTQKEGIVNNNLRIRKLTPRECFRLMGVKDEDFDKVSKNQSDSSLYHLAGDSIVVNVLMAIFKELL